MLDFKELKKISRKNVEGREYRVAVLGNVSTQFLSKSIEGYGKMSHINIKVFDGEYNQIELQLLNNNSELYKFMPQMVILYLSSEKLYEEFLCASENKKKIFAEDYMDKIESYWKQLFDHIHANIIQPNFTEIDDRVYGNFSSKNKASFIYQIRKLNYLLELKAETYNDVYLLDLLSIQIQMGAARFFDANLYYDSKMAISIDALPNVAKNIIDIINSLDGRIKKCLILDLDNTLWGGIVGDDGIDGIQIGEYGIGHVYSNLQLYFKQLKEAGIILCVCSKNDEEVAKAPFIELEEMALKLSDFAVFVANWNDKAENIRLIQRTLNIGFDSMVFIDDSKFERNLVRENIPEITVPELPDNPAEYLAFICSQNYFETAAVSEENKNRTRQYQEEYERLRSRAEYTTIDEYLSSLGMQAKIASFMPQLYNRISQLSQRSNQFNLRTIRYTPDEIKAISEDDYYLTYYVSLRDKHGDYGLVSVIILEKKSSDTVFINTWLMSCRVLNRGVEEFVMNCIVEDLKSKDFKIITGEYIATPKNKMVEQLLPNMGFEKNNEGYVLELLKYNEQTTYIMEEEHEQRGNF